MIILLDNPTKGEKVTVTKEYNFGKGEYTETCTIVAVWNGKIMLDTGETFHYFSKY